ncbi:MAG: hotdog fold thioesterase [Catalinimonas sp.]
MFPAHITIDDLRRLVPNTLLERIGIEFTELGGDFIRARMPVDEKTHTPFGLLHGGASVALAETLGSVGAALLIDTQKQAAVGLEINANHVRGVRTGWVTGTTRALHRGRSTHIWETHVVDERERLVCISRLTVAIIDKM